MARKLVSAYHAPELIPTGFHDSANLDGTPRLKRGEQRAMAIKLLITILVYTDWKTLQVGYRTQNGDFQHRSLAFLGYCSGYPHRDMPISGDPEKDLDMAGRFTWAAKRVLSASRYLQKIGAITIHKRAETLYDDAGNPVLDENGSLQRRALVAIKTVNPAFLQMLGIRKVELKRLRDHSSQSQAKTNQRQAEQRSAANSILASRLADRAVGEADDVKERIVNKGGYARLRNLVAFDMVSKGEKPDAKTIHNHAKAIIEARSGPDEPEPAPPDDRELH